MAEYKVCKFPGCETKIYGAGSAEYCESCKDKTRDWAAGNPRIRVFEIDQWGVRGAVGQPFEDLDRAKITDGDAGAVLRISGGMGRFRDVKASDWPSLGEAWLIPDEKGMAKTWKLNADSSD